MPSIKKTKPAIEAIFSQTNSFSPNFSLMRIWHTDTIYESPILLGNFSICVQDKLQVAY